MNEQSELSAPLAADARLDPALPRGDCSRESRPQSLGFRFRFLAEFGGFSMVGAEGIEPPTLAV